MMITIEIHYKLRSEAAPQCLALTPEEYFDPLEEDERYETDAVSRFAHAIQYLDYPPEAVEWTRLELSGTEEDRTITSRFSVDGGTDMWHRRDPDGSQGLCLDVAVGPGRRLIARLSLDGNGDWIPGYFGVFQDQDDGREREEKIRFAAP